MTIDLMNLRSLLMLSISIHNNGVNVVLAHDLLPREALSDHNFECVFWLELYVTLCISIIFFADNLGKASLIFRISSVFPLVACANDLMFLWCLDLAKMLVLGLGGIGGNPRNAHWVDFACPPCGRGVFPVELRGNTLLKSLWVIVCCEFVPSRVVDWEDKFPCCKTKFGDLRNVLTIFVT